MLLFYLHNKIHHVIIISLPLKQVTNYSIREKTQLCVRSLELIKRANIVCKDVIMLHNRDILNQIYSILPNDWFTVHEIYNMFYGISSKTKWSPYKVEEYCGAKV